MTTEVQVVPPESPSVELRAYHTFVGAADVGPVKRTMYMNWAELSASQSEVWLTAQERMGQGWKLDRPVMMNWNESLPLPLNGTNLALHAAQVSKQYPTWRSGWYRICSLHSPSQLGMAFRVDAPSLVRNYWELGSEENIFTLNQQLNYMRGQIDGALDQGWTDSIVLVLSRHYEGNWDNTDVEQGNLGRVPNESWIEALGTILTEYPGVTEVLWWGADQSLAIKEGYTAQTYVTEYLPLEIGQMGNIVTAAATAAGRNLVT